MTQSEGAAQRFIKLGSVFTFFSARGSLWRCLGPLYPHMSLIRYVIGRT